MSLILHVILAAFVGSTFADEQMTIYPNGQEQIKAKGTQFALTCQLNVPQADLIRDFQWSDPKKQIINADYVKQNTRISSSPPPQRPNQLGLVFRNLNEVDAGVYTCSANYDTKTITQSVNLKVILPITFIDAPEHQLAKKGQKNFKLKCNVQALPSPTVSWEKAGIPITNSDKYVLENDGLVIQNVQESDDGAFSCVVTVLETGDYSSRSIKLEVISDPVFLPDVPTEVNVTEGEKAVIPCSATGKPKPTFSWIKKATKKNMTTIPIYDGWLNLEKVTKEDDDVFTCVASNLANTVHRDIKVHVLSKPSIVEVVNSTIVAEKNGQITCYAYGNPLPTVTIRKMGFRDTNDVRLSLKQKADPKGRRNTVEATLSFSHVQKSDDGLYECVASNGVGETISNLHLTVEYKPTFERSVMVNRTVTWSQKQVNLTCVAQAIPNATIMWYQGSNPMSLDKVGKSYYEIFSETGKSTLRVTPIDRVVYGFYKCRAFNQYGEDIFDIKLEEAYVPEAIRNVRANTTTATSVTFEFADPAFTGNLPIKGYHVQFTRQSQGWEKADTRVWPVGGPYIITGLQPSGKYSFRFAAENDVGRSSWGGFQELETPNISEPSEPVIISTYENNARYSKSSFAHKIDLRWTIPSSNGPEIDEYILRYCLSNENEMDGLAQERPEDCESKKIPFNEILSSYSLDGLSPNTLYKIQLAAHNSVGMSKRSERFFKTSATTETIEKMNNTGLSSAVIIYIIVALLIGLSVIIDIFCFFVGKTGVIYTLCGGCCLKKKKNDDKLGSESRDLITNGLKNKVDIEEQSPMITDGTKRDTAVEYDVKKGVSKTGFVGKDSAV